MRTPLLKGLLATACLLVLANFQQEVFAGKIDLDNTSTTTTSRFPTTTSHLYQYSRFSIDGLLIETGFAPDSFPGSGPTKVSVYSLSDYGITTTNIDQLGSLLQIQFNVNVCCTSVGSASGNVSLFLIDPANPTVKIVVGSNFVNTPIGGGTVAIFSVSQFGALPANITPDFYIGLTGSVGMNASGLTGEGSRLTILSTIPTPEPASMFLFITGIAGSGIALRRRRRKLR